MKEVFLVVKSVSNLDAYDYHSTETVKCIFDNLSAATVMMNAVYQKAKNEGKSARINEPIIPRCSDYAILTISETDDLEMMEEYDYDIETWRILKMPVYSIVNKESLKEL